MSPCWQYAHFISKMCNCSLISLIERKSPENRISWEQPWFGSLLEIISNNWILVLYDRSFLIIGAILTKLLSHDNAKISYYTRKNHLIVFSSVKFPFWITESLGLFTGGVYVKWRDCSYLTCNNSMTTSMVICGVVYFSRWLLGDWPSRHYFRLLELDCWIRMIYR